MGRLRAQREDETERVIRKVLEKDPQASLADIKRAGAKGNTERLGAIIRGIRDELGIPLPAATMKTLVLHPEIYPAENVTAGWQKLSEEIGRLKGTSTYDELISIEEGLGAAVETLKSHVPLIGVNGNPMTDGERMGWLERMSMAYSSVERNRDLHSTTRAKWRDKVQKAMLKTLNKCFPGDLKTQQRVFAQWRVELKAVTDA